MVKISNSIKRFTVKCESPSRPGAPVPEAATMITMIGFLFLLPEIFVHKQAHMQVSRNAFMHLRVLYLPQKNMFLESNAECRLLLRRHLYRSPHRSPRSGWTGLQGPLSALGLFSCTLLPQGRLEGSRPRPPVLKQNQAHTSHCHASLLSFRPSIYPDK